MQDVRILQDCKNFSGTFTVLPETLENHRNWCRLYVLKSIFYFFCSEMGMRAGQFQIILCVYYCIAQCHLSVKHFVESAREPSRRSWASRWVDGSRQVALWWRTELMRVFATDNPENQRVREKSRIDPDVRACEGENQRPRKTSGWGKSRVRKTNRSRAPGRIAMVGWLGRVWG